MLRSGAKGEDAMLENETNVPAEGTPAEPAKTAENASAGGIPAVASGAADELPPETNVSPATWHEALEKIREIVAEYIDERLPAQIEKAKNEVIVHFGTMISAAGRTGAGAREGAAVSPSAVLAPESDIPLEVHDAVKVWADPEQQKFRIGKVVAVHDGGHAYDVELDDGTVSKIPAGGLEYDDRA